MLRKSLLALVVLLLGFVVVGLLLPVEYRVERSISIDRPAATLFTVLNSYRAFNEWSPWAERDPEAVYATEGAAAGVGARLTWSGDPRLVGAGWQEITRSVPFSEVAMQLNFGEQGEARSRFVLEPQDGSVRLTWEFMADVTRGQGPVGGLMGRYFGLFLDRWVGSDYEKGLVRLKSYVESLPSGDFATADIRVVDVQPLDIIYVSGHSSQDTEAVGAALAEAYAELSAFLADNGLQANGQPMAITRGWDENGYRFDAAIPVVTVPSVTRGRVLSGRSPGGRSARIVHRGPYETLLASYEKLAAYMAAHGLQGGPLSWEHYISDPGATPDGELVTHIYFQLGESVR